MPRSTRGQSATCPRSVRHWPRVALAGPNVARSTDVVERQAGACAGTPPSVANSGERVQAVYEAITGTAQTLIDSLRTRRADSSSHAASRAPTNLATHALCRMSDVRRRRAVMSNGVHMWRSEGLDTRSVPPYLPASRAEDKLGATTNVPKIPDLRCATSRQATPTTHSTTLVSCCETSVSKTTPG